MKTTLLTWLMLCVGVGVASAQIGSGNVAGPASATVNDCAVFANTTGKLLKDNGACPGGGTGNAASVVTTTFSGTPTFTCPSASADTVTTFELSTTLTANITGSTLASCTSGQTLNFVVQQDGTGGRTIVWPTGFTGMCQPNPILNTITVIEGFWDGTSAYGQCSTNGTSIGAETVAPSGNPSSTYEFNWLDSTGLFPRWKNSAGTIFQGSKELTANDIRCAGGANTVDFACTAIPGAVTATTQSACDNSTKLASTAYLSTTCNIVETSGSPLAATAQSQTLWNNTAGAYVVDLPATASGLVLCLGNYKLRAGAISFVPPSGSTIYYKGVAGTTSSSTGIVSGGAAGDFICVEAVDTTTWEVAGSGQGTFTNN